MRCARPTAGIVRLLPLALTTIVEEAADVHRFQIVQTAADRLLLRLDRHGIDDVDAAWRAAAAALREYLNRQSLPGVDIGLDELAPVVDRKSGKLREVAIETRAAPMHH